MPPPQKKTLKEKLVEKKQVVNLAMSKFTCPL